MSFTSFVVVTATSSSIFIGASSISAAANVLSSVAAQSKRLVNFSIASVCISASVSVSVFISGSVATAASPSAAASSGSVPSAISAAAANLDFGTSSAKIEA